MPRSLLLVDDDEDLRTTLRHLLSDEGFHVYTARNGQEALNRLREIEPPGLILLDLMMPVMDGSQFLDERGTNPELKKIPVVVMTAWTRDWNGQTDGAVAILKKPIQPEQLLAIVERYCDRDSKGDPRRR